MRHFSEFDRSREVRLDGAHNARDLGGFKTSDGGTVRRGLVFRSDELSRLTDRDLAALSEIGIKTVVDFRSREEMTHFADKCPSRTRLLGLSIDSGDLAGVVDEVNDETGPKLMREVNRSLVRRHADVYSDFFSLLTSGADIPLLFHCAAGKDRTGFAAAMFLASLGVSRGDIMRDYMLSVEGAVKKYGAFLEREPQRSSIVIVRPEYLEAAFDEIEAGFGTVESYLTEGLGVDLDKMREIFVE